MADFPTAVAITLANEGGFYNNPSTGEISNFGITAKFLSAHSLPCSFSDVHDLTLPVATALYLEYFWKPLLGDLILAQPIANKLFDIDVNQGGVAVKEMQATLNDLGVPWPRLVVDGAMGPRTLAAINSTQLAVLLPAFQHIVERRYREIAAGNPLLASDLGSISPPKGWLGRLYS